MSFVHVVEISILTHRPYPKVSADNSPSRDSRTVGNQDARRSGSCRVDLESISNRRARLFGIRLLAETQFQGRPRGQGEDGPTVQWHMRLSAVVSPRGPQARWILVATLCQSRPSNWLKMDLPLLMLLSCDNMRIVARGKALSGCHSATFRYASQKTEPAVPMQFHHLGQVDFNISASWPFCRAASKRAL